MVFEDVPKVNAPLILLAQNEPFAPPGLRELLEASGCVVEVSAVEDQVIEIADVMQPDVIILDASGAKGAVLQQHLRTLPIPLFVLHDQPTDGAFDKNDTSAKTLLQVLRASGHLAQATAADLDSSASQDFQS
jgi:chemotaxis response regulator CheB